MSGRGRRPGRLAGMRPIQIWVRTGSPLDRLLQPRGPRGPRWGRYIHLFLEQHLDLLRAFLVRQGIMDEGPPSGEVAEEPAPPRRPAFSGVVPSHPPAEGSESISLEELRRAAREIWDWGGR